jgi:hypothetical protein
MVNFAHCLQHVSFYNSAYTKSENLKVDFFVIYAISYWSFVTVRSNEMLVSKIEGRFVCGYHLASYLRYWIVDWLSSENVIKTIYSVT